jgi:hypothetical protein
MTGVLNSNYRFAHEPSFEPRKGTDTSVFLQAKLKVSCIKDLQVST